MERMACETEKSFMSVICTKIGVGLECGEWMGECGESMETNGACDLMPPPPKMRMCAENGNISVGLCLGS